LGTCPIGIPFGHFVFDACAKGQKLKCLTLIDEFTKESLRIDVVGSIKGKRVVQVLEEVIAQRGYPKVLRNDNGPEFVSTILLEWAVERGLHNLHIEPDNLGKTVLIRILMISSGMSA